MDEEEFRPIGAIMENVNRLVDDASLLISGNRFPSAFVLEVIALEEVGKVVQMRWRHLGRPTTRQNRTGHLQKQWAVACLLIADKLLPFFKAVLLGPADEQPLRMIEMAAAFMDSAERRFFERVIAKNVDRAKQLGLYEDEGPVDPSLSRESLDADALQEISDTILRAVRLLSDEAVLTVASIFYEIVPPLQDAIIADGKAENPSAPSS